MAEIAISTGRLAGSICSMSITTDVSTSPLDARGSATGRHGLIDEGVHIPAKTATRDRGRAGKRRVHDLGRHERPLTQRHELSDRPAIPRDDERRSAVEGAHNPPAVVSQLALRDPTAHGVQCSAHATRASATMESELGFDMR
jgi:hypothetical protein